MQTKRIERKYLSYKLLIGLCLILIVSFNAMGQNPKNMDVIPRSPNVAALEKFTDIPVSLYTGVPSISIPIFTLKEGDISVPVQLSYHSAGIKVEEVSSWVGTGWALSAGGVISRMVQGGPDEGDHEAHQPNSGYYRNYGAPMSQDLGAMNCIVWADEGITECSPNTELSYTIGAQSGYYDTEPDIFYFNFNGYSGKFAFDITRQSQIITGENLKIDVIYNENYNTQRGRFMQFVVTTPDGMKYYFGGNDMSGDEAIEQTGAVDIIPNYFSDSGWYLTKIKSSDSKDSILFDYDKETYRYQMLPTCNFTVSDGKNNGYGNPGLAGGNFVYNNLKGLRLNKISCSSGSISFIADTSNPRNDLSTSETLAERKPCPLKEIKISNNDFCKRFIFHTFYTISSDAPYTASDISSWPSQVQVDFGKDKNRLFLDYIEENDCSEAQNPKKYLFTYNSPNDLPRRLSFSRDHWGYFNGANNNISTGLLPTIISNGAPYTTFSILQSNPYGTGSIIRGGANREPSWPQMSTGLLTQITYPTGGHTEFKYNAHDYYGTVDQLQNNRVLLLSTGVPISTSSSASPVQNLNFSIPAGSTAKITFSYQFQNTTSGVLSGIASVSKDGANWANLHLDNISTQSSGSTSQNLTLQQGTYNFQVSVDKGWASLDISLSSTSQVFQNIQIGGNRISEVDQYVSSSSLAFSKKYKYSVFDGSDKSSGVLLSKPVYNKLITTANHVYLSCLDGSKNYFISASSINPMQSIQGDPIGYKNVTVYETGNGRSEFEFNVYYDSYYEMQQQEHPCIPVPFNFDLGNLLKERHFIENGTNPIVENQYFYNTAIKNKQIIGRKYSSLKLTVPCIDQSSAGINVYNSQVKYTISIGKSLLKQKIETQYFPSGTLSKTTDYLYNSYWQQTQQQTTNSDGHINLEKSIYPTDLCPNIELINSDLYDSFATFYSQSNKSQIDYYQNSLTQYEQLAKSRISSYQTLYTNTFTGAPKGSQTDIVFTMNTLNQIDQPIEKTHWIKQNSTSALTLPLSERYRFDYTKESKIKLMEILELANYNGSITSFTPVYYDGSAVQFDSQYKSKTTLDYSSSRLSFIKNKDNIPTVLLWGYNYQYPIAEIKNATYADVKTALGVDPETIAASEVPDMAKVNGLRTTLINALVTTYTYQPLVGMTSTTDPRGVTTNYVYDTFGRLQLVKDDTGYIRKAYEYYYKK